MLEGIVVGDMALHAEDNSNTVAEVMDMGRPVDAFNNVSRHSMALVQLRINGLRMSTAENRPACATSLVSHLA
eukprot:1554944-Amphidinium_carterae.1